MESKIRRRDHVVLTRRRLDAVSVVAVSVVAISVVAVSVIAIIVM